jgi:hypothetical protein
MAKLSVVVPSNEVEVNGQKYRKVDREAQSGDIVKITDEDAPNYIKDGAFYAVEYVDSSGDPQITDEDGDEYDLCSTDFEVYEKVTEPAAVEYREVKRAAEKGERVRIVDRWSSADPYENGAELVVKSRLDNHRIEVEVNGRNTIVNDKEYVVLEPVNDAKPIEPAPHSERLKVGDYVKVTDASGSGYAKKGDIAAVTNDNWLDSRGKLLDVKTLDGRTYGMYAHRFVRATESEVEAAKKAAERAKQIGEFADGGYAVVVDASKSTCLSGIKNGDYVTVKVDDPNRNVYPLYVCGRNGGYCNADALRKVAREEYEEATKPRLNVGDLARTLVGKDVPKGAVVKITEDDRSGRPYRGELLDGSEYDWYTPEQLEKVSAEEAKWTAIGRKVGEYKAGDVIEIMEGHPAAGVKTGDVSTVKEADLGAFGGSGVRLTSLNPSGNNAWLPVTHIKLLVPVEQRFDRSEGGASPSK